MPAALDGTERVLQVEDHAPQFLARAAVAVAAAVIANVRLHPGEHAQVYAGGEMPAGAGNHADARRGGLVEPAHRIAQLGPHAEFHGVGALWPVEFDGRNLVNQCDFECLEFHARVPAVGGSG